MTAPRPVERLHYTVLAAIAVAAACAKAEESPLADQGGDTGGKGASGGSAAAAGSGVGGSGGSTSSGGSAGKGGSTGGSAGKGGTSSTGGKGGTSTGGSAGKGGTSTGGSAGSTPTTYGCLDGEGGQGGASGGAPGDGGAGGSGPDSLFSDDFEDGNADGWTPVSGTWAIASDDSEAYAQSDLSNNNQYISAVTGACWADQIVEARVKVVSFNGNSTSYAAGLFARYVSAQTHYMLGMNSGSNGELFIGKRVQSSSTAPDKIATKNNMHWVEGTWYRLRLEIVGTSLRGYVDDALQLEITDAQITSGGVAVGTRHASARFDDVKVTRP